MKRLLLLLLLLPFCVLAQEKKPHTTYLTRDTLINSRSVEKNWRYCIADSPAMASAAYNDSSWSFTKTEQYIKNDTSHVLARFNNVMWLRLHFVVDTSLVGLPLAITMSQLGASELYVDGKLIDASGTINGKDSSAYEDQQWLPMVFQLSAPGEHVLAVRYANFDALHNHKIYKRDMAGFHMRMGLANKMIENDRGQTVSAVAVFMFLFGLFVALSLLHLLLFLYYKQIWSNLYFSLLSLSLGVFFLLIFLGRFSILPSVELIDSFIAFAATSLACIAFSGFTNELFNKSKLRFRIISSFSLLIPLVWFFDDDIGIYYCIIMVMSVLIESVILTIKGIIRKVPGARIIGIGVLFFGLFFLTIATLAIIFQELSFDESTLMGQLAELLGIAAILSIPLSMSIYLAWSFSAMNKDLKKQVIQIKELSDKTIKQEQEQKELLEQQNQELEYKVSERTQEVQHQKELVEIKNKAITDNLLYAQRIQSAILPDINLVHKTLGQSFILYLPKDIVSGDFYSFNKKDEQILIAAGDCTGHGVSGAFMSMIGSSLLNQIINEKGITQPAEILNNLNIAVIDALKQSQNESTDGMDIALCSFNLADNELQYAGANRPIYLVRNNALEIIKPDKLPIGGLQVASNRIFTNNTLKLQAGDTIYLFTDGYTDQFGGERDKKLMVARFKEILLSIQHLDMPAQLTYLHNYFENWKGSNEQVDDVLVMGIRV